MGKSVHDDVYDAALKNLADNGNKQIACNAEPLTYTEANATYALADVALTVGDGNGDYTIGNGDVSGRKVNVVQKALVPIDTSGTASHIAIVDTVNSKLLTVTTLSAGIALTAGNTVTMPTHDPLELADPT